MKEYLARDLIAIHQYLLQVVSDSFRLLELEERAGKRGKPGIPAKVREISGKIEFVKQQAMALGLRSTTQGAARFLQNLKNPSGAQVDKDIGSLHDDLIDVVFLYLPSEKLAFRQKTDLFGDTFKLNFPTANTEVIEAGNCYALGRNTACVFYLMRGLEVVLKALFRALGLPPLGSAGERNWNGILQKIRTHLDANKSMSDFDFYDKAYAFLMAAKNPLRNATMHVDASYDEEGARIVFDAMAAFMRHAATKLKEYPN